MLLKRLRQEREHLYDNYLPEEKKTLNWLWLVPLFFWPITLWLLFNGGSFFETIRNSNPNSALVSPVPSTNSQFVPGVGGGPELRPTPTPTHPPAGGPTPVLY